MTTRKILLHSEDAAALRRKSDPVQKANKRVQMLVQDLKDTLLAHSDGAGLAAPQINVHQRVVVVRPGLRDEDDTPTARRETSEPSPFLRCAGEGPGMGAFQRVSKGFDAILVHHEIDHLDGVLFIDRIEQPEDLYTIRRAASGWIERIPLPDLLPVDKVRQ